MPGIPKQQVDGLRVTDAPTLDVVVAVLAGAINTRLVAAVRGAGGSPVGLTGADADGGDRQARRADHERGRRRRWTSAWSARRSTTARPRLLTDLLARGYTPVVACIGATRDGQLLNVNADTLASHLAAALGATRLVIAGGTAGVLDEQGQTIARLTAREAAAMIRGGTANKGMVAKLEACRAALPDGVGDVLIANGRQVPFASAGRRRRRRRPAAHRWCDEGDIRRHQGARIAPRAPDLPAPAGGVRARQRRASCTTSTGREYLDLVSGIGVTSLGHAHPGLAAAIADQASTLLHTSNLYYHPFQAEAASRLAQLSGLLARVLLQQRHRGGRGVPEVRAPLLAHAGRHRPQRRSSPSRAGSPAARWARCR